MRYSLLIIFAASLMFWAFGHKNIEMPTSGHPTAIEFWTYAAGGSPERTHKFWSEVALEFERRHPEARVRLITDINQGNYMQMISARAIGGGLPDVLILDDNMLPPLNVENLLVPLDYYIEKDKSYHTTDFAPGMVSDSYAGGKRCSIPWYGGFPCLYYRTDLLAKAGVRSPKDYNQLIQTSRILQQKSGLKYPFATYPTQAFFVMPMIWQNGGCILGRDFRRVSLDDSATVSALSQLRDLMYVHKIMDPALASGGEPLKLWGSGQAAMILDGIWMEAILDTNYPDLKGKWAASPAPVMGSTPAFFYGGQHLAMTRDCKHKDLAWEFMAIATSPEMQERWSDIIGSPPGNLKTFDRPTFRKNHPDFWRMKPTMLQGCNNPLAPFFGEIWYTRFTNEVLDVVMKDPNADIKSALERAKASMQTAADDYWTTHPYFVQGKGNELWGLQGGANGPSK